MYREFSISIIYKVDYLLYNRDMNVYIIEKIEDQYKNNTHTFQSISDCILSHKNSVFDMTLTELSNASFCAQSTVLRFIQSLGFDSYTVFKHELNSDDYTAKNDVLLSINLVETHPFTQVFIESLVLVINKSNTIYIIAAGYSELCAKEFFYKAQTLNNLNLKYINEPEQLNDLTSQEINSCCFLFISNSGRTNKWIKLSKNLNSSNSFLITNRDSSPLADNVSSFISLNNKIENDYTFKELPYFSLISINHLLHLIFNELV